MKQSRTGTTTLAKLATMFATILVVSAGLCGTQFYVHSDEYVSFAGIIGLVGLIISVPGLLVTGLIGLVRLVRSRMRSDFEDDPL